MKCAVLLWIVCFETVILFWALRRTAFYYKAYHSALKVGRQIQDRADYWRTEAMNQYKENGI